MERRVLMARACMAIAAMDAWAGATARAATGVADVVLPAPEEGGALSLGQALRGRRSVRRYTGQAVSLAAVSRLLWAAQGVTTPDGRRTAPSAGALYPLELHVVGVNVEALARGTYRYVPAGHALRPSSAAADPSALARAAFGQQPVADAAAVFVIAAVAARTVDKYGARGTRFVAFEAGAAAQNLALQAVAEGLGTVVIGALDESAAARALGLAAAERPLVLMPIGRPA